MSKYGSAVDGWDFFFKGTICRILKRLKLLNEPVAVACVHVCVCVRVLSLVWLLHSCRLLTCKTDCVT